MLPSTGIVATSRSGVGLEHLDAHPLDERALELQASAARWSGPVVCGCVGHDGDAMPTPRGSDGGLGCGARRSAPSVADTRLRRVSRLLLLDGHSLAYRAFFALPAENFSTSTGQHTNAVYGFTSMLINMLRDEQPTHVVVAFDKSRQTFRTEQYAEYKAGRARTPDEFSGQLPLVKEVLDALRIRFVELEGYEADDIIATIATEADAQGVEVLICSGDRDTFQLVSDNVDDPLPGPWRVRGVAHGSGRRSRRSTACRRTRYSDLAAMVGETSDNLPGVPGRRPQDRREVDHPVR